MLCGHVVADETFLTQEENTAKHGKVFMHLPGTKASTATSRTGYARLSQIIVLL